LQKNLKKSLSTWGATSARFVYAAPLAIALTVVLMLVQGNGAPSTNGSFFGYAVIGGLAQILATGLLVHLFSYQNFTVATAFTKTEPIQTALFGIVLLGDVLSPIICVAILISLLGVILISIPHDREKGKSWFDRRALIGIASGALFGLSAVAYRGASLALEDGDVIMRASFTLTIVTIFQSVVVLLVAAREATGARPPCCLSIGVRRVVWVLAEWSVRWHGLQRLRLKTQRMFGRLDKLKSYLC